MLLKEELQDQARALYNDYRIEYVGSFGEFGQPTGMDIDEEGTVFAFDNRSGCLNVFDPDRQKLSEFKTSLTITSRLAASSNTKLVFVIDKASSTVAIFSYDGEYKGKLAYKDGRVFQFITPVYIKLDRQGALWVTDACRHTIEGFDESGIHQNTITTGREFELPFALAFDEERNFCITSLNDLTAPRYMLEYIQNGVTDYNLIRTSGKGAFEKIQLPTSKEGQFSDIQYDDGHFYLSDGRSFYKFDSDFNLIYKLRPYQVLEGFFTDQDGWFPLFKIVNKMSVKYLYLMEVRKHNCIFVFKI